jgi:hypothetical protein
MPPDKMPPSPVLLTVPTVLCIGIVILIQHIGRLAIQAPDTTASHADQDPAIAHQTEGHSIVMAGLDDLPQSQDPTPRLFRQIETLFATPSLEILHEVPRHCSILLVALEAVDILESFEEEAVVEGVEAGAMTVEIGGETGRLIFGIEGILHTGMTAAESVNASTGAIATETVLEGAGLHRADVRPSEETFGTRGMHVMGFLV